MTVTQRKPQHQLDEIQTVNEPGVQYQCDSCGCDLTHTIRIKCADPICEPDDGVDICPPCFCAGKEFGKHKRSHSYRVIVGQFVNVTTDENEELRDNLLVQEIHAYPIFSEDWGADEELLLVKGIASQGLGNWKKIADHVGTRTKEEVEEHYNSVYVDSPNWPLPRLDLQFDIDPAAFQERKRRRISAMNATAPPPPKIAPTSAPGVHEIATFLPGRLEFEHELDNDAEDLVKDLEFGVCLEFGGDEIIEDENDLDVRARIRWEEERSGTWTGSTGKSILGGKGPMPVNGLVNGVVNGYHPPAVNGDVVGRKSQSKSDDVTMTNGNGSGDEDGNVEEPTQPPPIETQDSINFKLTLLEMYFQRVGKRLESKAIIFDRGLLEYKKMQAAEKKRPREEREIVHRLRPFARLQTAEDFEAFGADILYEAILRKRIQELQQYRRLGLTTAADIEKYDLDLAKRTQAKAAPPRDYYSSERLQFRAGGRQSSGPDHRHASLASFGGDSDRRSHERELTPRPSSAVPPVSGTGPIARKPPAPLNLANSPSLHLLTPAEQTLCSQLRILPKPYLVIKETLVREYARRGGKLRRREARDLVKIDVNKTSRVWDFLVQAGFLKITTEPSVPAVTHDTSIPSTNPSTNPSLNGSPLKDVQVPYSPAVPPVPVLAPATSSQNGPVYNTSTSALPTATMTTPWSPT